MQGYRSSHWALSSFIRQRVDEPLLAEGVGKDGGRLLGDPHRFASRHFPVTDDKHVLRNDCAGFSNGFTQYTPGPWQPIVSAGKGYLVAVRLAIKLILWYNHLAYVWWMERCWVISRCFRVCLNVHSRCGKCGNILGKTTYLWKMPKLYHLIILAKCGLYFVCFTECFCFKI